MEDETLDVLLKEKERFKPPAKILKKANIKNLGVYGKAAKDPVKFWEDAAKELEWYKKWGKALDSRKKPFFKWFVGGRCNIVHNAIDRHLKTKTKNKTAIIGIEESGRTRKATYSELNDLVCRFSNVLKNLGVKKGDKVTTYLPNIIEHAVAMLSCAKIGAIHSVVYAGFSSPALAGRINDAGSVVVITADVSFRKGKTIDMKGVVDEALKQTKTVKKVVVVKRSEQQGKMGKKDVYWHDEMEKAGKECRTEIMDAEDPAFILYTSGTTGTPKGVVHVHGGYMVGVARTLRWVFDIKDDDIFWCTADPGWITGHSYIVYGPLMLGCTTVMFDGVPMYPQPDTCWELVEKHKVTIFYTAPTAVRSLMTFGDEWAKKHEMKTLRILGSVGEPINPEAWRWYHKFVGKGRCPIMDTWWQTETGSFMITPLPILTLKPGSATRPFPGIDADVVDEKGRSLPPNKGGFLVIRNPWPSMLRTVYNNPKRYLETYWEKIPGVYLTGDVARKDEDGYFWIAGRQDDVIKIAGHRIGTMELESAFVSHPKVAEAAVIGKPDPIRGQVAKAFIILRRGIKGDDRLKEELSKHIVKEIGPIAIVKEIDFVDKLPKTRSGKIMRRVLKAKELGLEVGDLSTLED